MYWNVALLSIECTQSIPKFITQLCYLNGDNICHFDFNKQEPCDFLKKDEQELKVFSFLPLYLIKHVIKINYNNLSLKWGLFFH